MPMRFDTKAKLGYALLVALLTSGMAYAIHRLSSAADEQLARIRSEEQEITAAEQLRWSSSLLVASGRAYLLSPEPELYARVQTARNRFEELLDDFRDRVRSARGLALVAEVENVAETFVRVQSELIEARRSDQAPAALIEKFDRELLPLSRRLGDAVADLVKHKEASLDAQYANVRAERARLELGLYVLLGLLALAGLVIAWRFAAMLGRSYRKEHLALAAARSAVAARDEVIGIVAHDLRTPLGALAMRAALIRKAADSDRVRQHADWIENVVMRMEYLIRTMLDVATMEAGRFAVIPGACDVDELVREAVGLFEPLASAKQVEIAVDNRTQGLVIHADRERVMQVLSNLLGNALKFTPRQGRVSIEVKREGDMVRFGVFDTGPGISRERLAHVFERFWTDPAPGSKGTGLGLFIARGIIEAHGGQIWANSNEGRGARFYFTLPLEMAPRVPTARVLPQPDPEVPDHGGHPDHRR